MDEQHTQARHSQPMSRIPAETGHKETDEILFRLKNVEFYEASEVVSNEEVRELPMRFQVKVSNEIKKQKELRKTVAKNRSPVMRLIMAAGSVANIVIGIPVLLSGIGLLFGMLMIAVGIYGLYWSAEMDKKEAEKKLSNRIPLTQANIERRNQENGEQQSRS